MQKDRPSLEFSRKILFILGLIDLLRGILHTIFVNWASQTFAKLDLAQAGQDQLTLLGAFGISNFLTGLLYLLISQKAKQIAPFVLAIIPIAYLTGFLALRIAGVNANADFLGKYFMLAYITVSAATAITYFIDSRKNEK